MTIKKSLRKKMNRSGVVLITVVTVMMMMVIIVSAALSFVQHETNKSYTDYKYKQAYYTATSCLESFMEQATKVDDATVDNIQEIANASAECNVQIDGASNVGDCTIKVEKVSSSLSSLKATSTCEYLGQKATVVAYFYLDTDPGISSFDKAIEITGTGGSAYNNTIVYGDVASINSLAHKNNVLFKMETNNSEVYGLMDLKGSASVSTGFKLHASMLNQTGDTSDGNLGAGLATSRSLFFTTNTPSVESTLGKNRTTDDSTYNFIKAGELVALNGNNVAMGKENFEVDVYGRSVVFGTSGSATGSNVSTIVSTANNAYGDDGTTVTGSIGVSAGNCQGYKQYGNVYSYNSDSSTVFNGDIIFTGAALNCEINGDLYAEGDIYFYGSGSTKINGNIYCKGSIKGTNYTQASGYEKKEGYNWTGSTGARAITNFYDEDGDYVDDSGNKINDTETKPYTYYPEHFLCLDDTDVTTISSIYKSFYSDNSNLDMSKVKLSDSVSESGYTDSNGNTFDYHITQSMIFDEFKYTYNGSSHPSARRVLIEVPSDQDIVIVVKSGFDFNFDTVLIKNNSTEDDPHFCYIVPDAGIGTVNKPVDIDAGDIGTYANDEFKSCHITMKGTTIMDYDTYYNSNIGGSTSFINPTNKSDLGGYDPGKNKTVFLLTEKTILRVNNGSLIQASIYGPKASEYFNIDPVSLKFLPNVEGNPVAIYGMAILGNLSVSNNNVGILYQNLAENSILKNARPTPATVNGYKLSKYAHY